MSMIFVVRYPTKAIKILGTAKITADGAIRENEIEYNLSSGTGGATEVIRTPDIANTKVIISNPALMQPTHCFSAR